MVLARLYQAEDRLPELLKLWEEANERGWWHTYKLPAWMQALVGLESDASAVKCFALELVPGLLQIADYARETFTRQGTPEAEVPKLVSVRMERQRRLGELQLDAIVSEALLARTVHMAPYGVEQLRWLTQVLGQRGVTVRVVPFAAGGHRSMSGSFTLLEFPDGINPPAAYREGALHGDLIDDPHAVADLYQVYGDLQEKALTVEDSADLIGQYVAGV
jgi:hypothetical protein